MSMELRLHSVNKPRPSGVLLCFLCAFGLFPASRGLTLKEAADEYRTLQYEWWPEFATSVGAEGYDERLTNCSLAAYKSRMEEASELLNKVNTIEESDSMTSNEKITLALLKNVLRDMVNGYAFINFNVLNPVSRRDGVQHNHNEWMRYMKTETLEDYRKIKNRLQATTVMIDQQIDLMKEAIRVKRTRNKWGMDGAISQIDNLLVTDPITNNSLFQPFINETAQGKIDQAGWQTLRNEVETMLKSKLIPKFKSLKTFLETDYYPNLRENEGVWAWQDGLSYYQACLKFHTSLTLSPKEIHDKGLQEVDRIEKLMERIIKRINKNFEGSIQSFFKSLENNTDFYGKDEDWLLTKYKEQVNYIDPFLSKFIKNNPGMPIEVKKMPIGVSGGYYTFPSDDGSVPGTFWVNLFSPEKKPVFAMMALTLHESNPGHHLQITSTLGDDVSLPEFRKHQVYRWGNEVPLVPTTENAFVEGWALYAEALGEEYDIFQDDYELLGKLSSEMFRASRLVIDTGIHAFGWTYEQAVDYMASKTVRPRNLIETEIKRYIGWPGQACSYKLGQLKILELREKAKSVLGGKFDIKEFNDVLLKTGAVPLDLLESVLDAWLATFTSQGNSASQLLSSSKCSVLISCILFALFAARK